MILEFEKEVPSGVTILGCSCTTTEGTFVEVDESYIVGYTRRCIAKTKRGNRYYYQALLKPEAVNEKYDFTLKYSIRYGENIIVYIDRKKNLKWKPPVFEENQNLILLDKKFAY